jgi:hypothetical protein
MIVLGSAFVIMLMVFGAFAASAANNNTNEPMGSSPLSAEPKNHIQANNYRSAGPSSKGHFTIIWTTDTDVTGYIEHSGTVDFTPGTGTTAADARGDTSFVWANHYCEAFPVPHGVVNYYYIVSDGEYWGQVGGVMTKQTAGGHTWDITVSAHKHADGAGAWYPVCGHLLYEGQSPPDGANSEIAVGWLHDTSGTHGGNDPGFPIADITAYGRALVEGDAFTADTKNGGYYFDVVWMCKYPDDSAGWTQEVGDTIDVKGFGKDMGYGDYIGYTLTWGWGAGTDLVPDITLIAPNKAPEASFTVEPESKPCGQPAVWDTVYFNSTSTDDKNSSDDLYYKWDFGDGSAIEEGYGKDGYNNRTHIYYASAVYTVTLNVTDNSTPSLSSETAQEVKIWPNRVSTTPLDVREASVYDVETRICWRTCIDTTGELAQLFLIRILLI